MWAVNKGTQYFAPKVRKKFQLIILVDWVNTDDNFQMMKTLYKACRGYLEWKQKNRPGYKPWIYPEQINYPKLLVEQV